MNFPNKKILIISLSLILILIAILFYTYKGVIFQRGNPLPYLLASLEISEETPYVEIGENTGIYISQRGECLPLLEFIEETQNVDFIEQGGNTYIFTDGINTITASSEIYLRYFTVWTVS